MENLIHPNELDKIIYGRAVVSKVGAGEMGGITPNSFVEGKFI